MRRTLNLKFAACLVVLLALFGTAVHFLHGYQVKRNASALLDQARRAREEGLDDKAAEYLGNYLRYVPGDDDALAEYALLLDKLAKSPKAQMRAYLVLDQVLRRQPERQDIRRRLAELAMKFGRFNDGEEHLSQLRQDPPKDAEIEELLGRCQLGRSKYRPARESFESAIKLSPDRIDSYVALAYLFHDRAADIKQKGEKLDGNNKADETLTAMIAANKDSYKAYLGRAQYLRRTARPEKLVEALAEAEKDLAEARRLAPEEADLYLASAEFAHARQDFAKVREYLRQGCDKHPKDARMYRFLAGTELEDGMTDEAAACLRRGLEHVPDDRSLQWELANVLVQQNKNDEADKLAEQLRKEHVPPNLLDYLQARLLLNKNEWLSSARLIERTYPHLSADRRLAEQAGLQLAFCYERLGDADRANAAYSRALAVNDLSAAARVGVARTLALTGQLSQAIDQYQQVLKLPRVPVSAPADLARLLILRNRQEAQPNWEEVDDLLRWAAKAHPSIEITILQAEVDADQGDFTAARGKLEKAGDKAERPVEVWVALGALENRQRRPADALTLLDEAERQLGDRVELRLARIRHWGARRGDEARKELVRLAETNKFSSEQQQVLLRALATAHARIGNTDEARRLWAQLAEQQKDALDVRIAQFDLAMTAGDEAGVAAVLEDMKRIEGPDGTIWRYGQASHLIAQARKEQEAAARAPALNEAHELLLSVASRRPRWSRVSYSEAQIDDLRGKPDAALANYRRAIQLGERGSLAIQRTAELLNWKRRYSEAYALLRKLPPETPLSEGMQKLYAEVALQGGNDSGRALELAEKAVAAGATDYRQHLWLGRMLWATRQPKKAEAAFRRAVRLADKAPEAWVTLIQYLVADKRTKEAEAEIDKARAKLPKDQADLALAQCYEAVGKLDRAQEFYQAALVAHPEDVPALQGAAGFALRTNKIPDAVAHLEKIVQLKFKDRDAADAARRVLAVVKTLRGDYQESRMALELVGLLEEGNVVDPRDGQTAQERRTQATLLAMQRSRGDRRRAIPILEDLIKRQEALPADRFLLAQLHEAMDDWPKARNEMLTLLSLPRGDAPRHLAYYARLLLRHEQPKEAEVWLRKLEKQQGDPFVVTEILARIAKAQGKGEEAVRLLERYAAGKDANRAAVAALLEELKETAAAERMYRAYVDVMHSKRPESVLVLAQFLGRQQKIGEALDLCERAWKSAPLAATQVCLILLSQPSATPAHYQRVERWLEAEAAKSNVTSSFSSALAHVKTLQGRFDEAEAIYRKAIAKNPRDGMALNNLAYLLAMRRERLDEAMQRVQQTFELLGPRPNLLDTRAVVLLSKGASELAIKDLKDAIAERPSATAYFHLAQAHYQARDRQAARLALQQAKARGLQTATLHPLEKTAYEELTRQLGG
ncbi:MAG TPA: tetratricopeptide repeat protein [Gemmataceae bacterium]|nr:tetratricopeptide repeat protein [Gemmataceae bacterium]